MHPDRSIHAVVDDDEHDRESILNGGRELLTVHQKATVAVPGKNDAIAMEEFCRDGGRDAVAHRARIRRELRSVRSKAKVPMDPARVIARAVGDDRVVRKALVEPADDLPQVDVTRHGARRTPRFVRSVRFVRQLAR